MDTHCRTTAAVTLPEMMVALAIGLAVMALILIPYLTLQKGFNFAMNWTNSRAAQTRLIDSMARDLRNATAVTTASGFLPLTLTIPGRYDAYVSAGNSAGEPTADSTFLPIQVSSVTGKPGAAGPDVTVIYEQSGNSINRRLQQPGVTAGAVRTISVFPAGASVSFQNINGGVFSSSDNTIVPVVSATVGSVTNVPLTNVMTDMVFLRNGTY